MARARSAPSAPQLGCSFFQALGTELGSGDYAAQAVDEFFRPLPEHAGRPQQYAARSVLIDMEPKVRAAAHNRQAGGVPMRSSMQRSGHATTRHAT